MIKLWIKKYYPDFHFWHADHALRSRHNVYFNAVKRAFWNGPRYVELLDNLLRWKEKDSKLDHSIFVCLSSIEITGIIRGISIVAINISEHVHWL